MTRQIVLGISPGGRVMGIAVSRNGQLIDWRLKYFKGPWNAGKLQMITQTVSQIIDRYQITQVALKIPVHRMEHIGCESLTRELIRLSKNRKIPVYRYSLQTLKHVYCDNKKASIPQLMATLASKYPELFHEYQKEQRNLNPYYGAMFEAVAMSLLASGSVSLKK